MHSNTASISMVLQTVQSASNMAASGAVPLLTVAEIQGVPRIVVDGQCVQPTHAPTVTCSDGNTLQ
jgi:hypothetical protein